MISKNGEYVYIVAFATLPGCCCFILPRILNLHTRTQPNQLMNGDYFRWRPIMTDRPTKKPTTCTICHEIFALKYSMTSI